MQKSSKKFSFYAGFTLIELMTVVTIMSLISVAVLFSYRSFSDNLTLSFATQEVIMALRQAQQYGVSVKESEVGSGQFSYAYGVYFNPDDSSHYYIFIDKNANKTYDDGSGCGSSNTECVSRETFRNGVYLNQICDSNKCPPHPSINGLHIVFLRPSPDAFISFTNNGGAIWQGYQPMGRIALKSSGDRTANIIIESTGQIYKQN